MTSNFDEIKEQQRKSWNKFSPGWKKWDSFVMDWLKPIGDKCLEHANLKQGDLILDVATGTGEPGLTAATKIGQGEVIGIDLAEDMIKIAQENTKSRGIDNYRAISVDACNTHFEDSYFDSIVSRHGVMFFPDPVGGLSELVRVLKQGGKIVVSAWAEPQNNPWATTIQEIINEKIDMTPAPKDRPGLFRCAEPGFLTSMLKEAGLGATEQVELRGTKTYPSPQSYWDFMTDVAAPISLALADVDSQTYDEIQEEVCNTVQSRSTNGEFSFDWSAWIGWGTK